MPSPNQGQPPWVESSIWIDALDEKGAKKERTSFAASTVLQTEVEPNTYSIAVCNLQYTNF